MQQQFTSDNDKPHSSSASPKIARATLLAKAIATGILGFLSSIRANQDREGIDFRPSQFNLDIVPMISNPRISAYPAIETRPRRSLPPEGYCCGTRPNQAAKSRPQRKLSIGGAKASTAKALISPMPCTVWRRRVISLWVNKPHPFRLCLYPQYLFGNLLEKVTAFL